MVSVKPVHHDSVWRLLGAALGFVIVAGVMASPQRACAEWLPSSTVSEMHVADVEPPQQTRDVPSAKGLDANDNAAARASIPRASRDLDGRALYRALIEKEVAGTGLAPEIAEAVMGAESSYDPSAISTAGAIGLMQVLPSTARMLGFTGSDAQLAEPATNVHYGVTYLAQAWRLAGADLCTAAMKYRAGHGESRFSYLSVSYCHAIRRRLVARGYPVTGTVPVATFGEQGASGCRRKCLGGGRVGNVNLAALNTRLSAIVMQVRATR